MGVVGSEWAGPTQKSFSGLEYASKRKTTRRERFFSKLERITPWSELLTALAPFYPKGADDADRTGKGATHVHRAAKPGAG